MNKITLKELQVNMLGQVDIIPKTIEPCSEKTGINACALSVVPD